MVLLGPYREKEASFYTVKEIWSPVFIPLDSLSADFDGRVPLENRYDFTSLDRCRFSWKTGEVPEAMGHDARLHHCQCRRSAGPHHPPRRKRADQPWSAGRLAPAGCPAPHRERPIRAGINTWSWTIQTPGTIRETIVKPAPGQISVTEDDKILSLRSGPTGFAINKQTGMLDRVEGFSFAGGPKLALGESTLTGLKHYSAGADHVVEATYSGAMRSVRWRFNASGWVRLDYEYQAEGEFDFMGVSFNYPEKNVTGMKWLGKGPYRVWKNRLKGSTHNVWTKIYNDTKTGVSWLYPEFKGYHDDFYWVLLDTAEGPITMITDSEDLYFRVFTPGNGPDPRFATAPFPPGDISFLHAIPPIGTKFNKPENLGPQGERNKASGVYKGTIYLYFGKLRSFS